MKHCGGCRRHLKVAEVRCPFCGATQSELRAAPAGPWALAATLAIVGCSGRPIADGDGGGSADDTGADGTTSTSTTAPPITTTTTVGSSSDPTTTGPVPPTSSGATDSDASTTDITGMSFVLYGGGDASPTIECAIADQDCPDGEKCNPWANDGGTSWNATRCTPLAPDPGEVGEACSFEGSQYSGVDDCARGTICLGDGLAGEGRCVELCLLECDTPGTVCVEEGVLSACLIPCDPFAAVPCAATEVCVGVGVGAHCMPALPPLAGYGAACEGVHNCASGHVCSAGALPDCDDRCCTALCDTSAPDPDALCPDAAAICTDPRWPAPADNVGICQQ